MEAMDLFPDGRFLRLRSRARDKYVHADDQDEDSVSLRPLGDVHSMNTVWKVDLRPVEGERGGNVRNVLLLQGAAYGRYLAVAPADDFPPSGHRGVRAVQRDYNSTGLDPSFVWTPYRVEAGKSYVRLHDSEQRCLRANGRPHRLRACNIVTVEAINGNETTMTQWRVEVIQPSPEPLPLPPPHCCACGSEGSTPLCRRCARRMKKKLLDSKSVLVESPQRQFYCLKCQEIFPGTHTDHEDKIIPIGRHKKQLVAWVTGEEPWKRIFQRIEAPDLLIKPYPLYKSENPRCKACLDIVSADPFYGHCLPPFCSLKCFVAGGGGQETTMEKAIIATSDYSSGAIGFCLTCLAAVFRGAGKTHVGHDWVSIRRNSDGSRPRVVIPDDHPMEETWTSIKKGPAYNEVLIGDEDSVRCRGCGKRLEGAFESCSVECSLDAAGPEPQFLPRSLQV